MANWTKICRDMDKYAHKDSERNYQESFKDLVIEGLGWKPEQIEEQKTLIMGCSERLIPDIVVSSDDCAQFVVEVKKPDLIRTQKDIEQLTSYMKQLETPVGIYVGKNLEVYYKTIGDGTEPILVLSLSFDQNEPSGEDFVKLFSAQNFSSANILAYIEKQNASERFYQNVTTLTNTITSTVFCDILSEYIVEFFEPESYSLDEIKTALSQLEIVIRKREEEKPDIPNVHSKDSLSRARIQRSGSYRNKGIAQRYAFNLIRQILEKNKTLHFRQLYNIFNRKNYIEDINNIKDESRWCMDEKDIFTSTDGTRIVVSNQWGFKNACKNKMDNLRTIAKSYGIDISLPLK